MKSSHNFKLSCQGMLKYSIMLALFSLPISTPAYSAIVESGSTNTAVSHIGDTPVVDIAAPDGSGISYNQYNEYNVTVAGAVLNNAQQAAQSQILQQLVASNPHLTQAAASTILNEVISSNPSLLEGFQEILGQQADLILANPYGITCDGCGFINTNAASLVVGKVEEFAESGLKYNTFKNQNRLNILEGGVRGAETLNLIAPSIDANGPIEAKQEIRAVLGNNIGDLKTAAVEQTEENRDHQTIDSYLLGGMMSGRIQLVSTNIGSGVNISGKIKGNDIDFQAQGDLGLKATQVGDQTTQRVNLSGQNVTTSGTIDTQTESHSDSGNRSGSLFRHGKEGSTKNTSQTLNRTTISGKNIMVGARENAYLKATEIQATDVTVTGKNVELTNQTVTNTQERTDNNWYMSWRSDYNRTASQDTSIGTEISATNVSIKATANDVLIKGSQIDATQNANIIAEKGNVNLVGSVTQHRVEETGYKRNDGAELRTGSWGTNNVVETSNASVINVGNNVNINAGNNVTTRNAQISASRDVNITAGQSVSIGADKTTNISTNSDDRTYWGGIGGGSETNKNQNNQTANGSRVKAKNDLEIQGNKLELSGSEALGGKEANVTAQKVKIDGAVTQDTTNNSTRTGTVFNITKDSQNTQAVQQGITSSELSSRTNLTVRGQDSVSISGSKVGADNNLTISSDGNVNIAGQSATGTTTTDTTSLGINTYAKEKTDKQYAAGIRLEHESTSQTVTTDAKTASSINGGNVNISSGKTATVAGSTVGGTNNVEINGENVDIVSSYDETQDDTHTTKVGVGFYYTGGIDKAGSGYEGSVDDTQTKITTSNANTSTIKSGGNIIIQANNTLTNEGSAYNAGGDVNLTANQIDNKAAVNTRTETTDAVSVGVDIGANINYSGITRPIEDGVNQVREGGVTAIPEAIASTAGSIDTPNAGIDAEVAVSNGTTTKTTTQSQVSSINGQNIKVSATQNATDQGTQYKATQSVNINADQYKNTAAVNSEVTTSDVTQGSVNVRVYTTTGKDIAVDGKGSGGNTKETQSTDNAVVSNIQAGNGVSIVSNQDLDLNGTVVDAGDGKAQLTSQSGNINVTQATNKTSQTSIGYGANAGVKAGFTKEKNNFGGSGGGNYKSTEKTENQAVTSTIAGKNGVELNSAKDVNLQGTDLVASESGNVSVTAGNNVNFNQVESSKSSSTREYSGNIELNQSMADGGKSKTLGGKIDGVYATNDQSSTTGKAGSIVGANNVDVKAGNDIYLQGTQIGSTDNKVGNVALNAGGDVTFDAQTSSEKQNGLDIRGGINATTGNVTNNESNTRTREAGANLEGSYVDENKAGQIGGTIQSTGNVSVNAQGTKGIALTGTKVAANSTTLNADNGSVSLQSAQSSEQRNNYGGSIGLNTSRTTDQNQGGNVAKSLTGVNAGIKVDIKDSLVNENANIESQQASVSSKGNVTLSGANITADNVSIQSQEGGLIVESRQDKDFAVNVEVGAGIESTTNKPAEKSQYDNIKDGFNDILSNDTAKPYKDKVTKYTDDKRLEFAWWYNGKKEDVKYKYSNIADQIDQDRENKAHKAPLWDRAAQSVGNKVDNGIQGLYKTDNKPTSGTSPSGNISVQVTDKQAVEQESGISAKQDISVQSAQATQLKGAKLESQTGTVDTGPQPVITETISDKNVSVRTNLNTDIKELGKQAFSDIKEGQTPLIGVKVEPSTSEGKVVQPTRGEASN
ncbi:hemagglutinin repeat-containing protein [Vibrio pectenicida]|uniref:Filamentous hemagglutinin N-terminal domain-containing protein n=1 Tax=Vibrio pectenicida TaxID=62763 RepID=A0A3R9DXU0_9VIBR|nr:hemagglutinin repeat-containing protein [Vibrio pectenicida]RSD29741.1 filamentous hemagglutinin N-terminal domain-containing protein [Vibrio pectenicida]